MNEGFGDAAARVLSEQEALVRAAEEQASVVLDLYSDESWQAAANLEASFIEARVKSLTELRNALRSALNERQLLPKEQDPEVRQWHFLVDRMRGLLDDEPLAVPLEEEKRLLNLCNELLRTDGTDEPEIRKYRDELVKATERLRSTD
jgi:hypothetical protein